MTVIQFILLAIPLVLVVFVGFYMIIRSFKRNQNTDAVAVNYDKNGIPIIPRHERQVIDQPDLEDTVSGETTIGPNRDYLNAVIEDEPLVHSPTNVKLQNRTVNVNADDEDADYARWQAEQQLADEVEFATLSKSLSDDEYEFHETAQELDAFSTLMSATDHLLPAVDTVDEPNFIDNSPILDQHLLSPVGEAQNGPLINAKDNINITILPNQYRDESATVIRGRDLLTLIDKYGLRFGAMNMFHRYEQKDGTGILWFSMMGITDKGIAPFDPHSVATDTYHGIVLFLSLPHPQALRSFDSMISIAYMIANDLDAMMLDENNEPITAEYKQQLRNQVRDYVD